MPEGTVKAVAESAMREVVGSTDSEKITTVARQSIETDVQALMQKVLEQLSGRHPDHAGAVAEGRSADAGHRFAA